MYMNIHKGGANVHTITIAADNIMIEQTYDDV